nr:xylulose kinase-1 [Tanacetum cinerariifolium]
MKMEYWIMNTEHNLWKIIQNRNNKKSLGRDLKGGIIILPLVFFEEYVDVQRETKARTLLLQSLPKDHMADFHHLDDAREIWLAVKARFGGNEESKKMRKTMLKHEFLEFSVFEEEGLHKGYDRQEGRLSSTTRTLPDLIEGRKDAIIVYKVKTEDPKAMVSVDSMLNWNEHEAKNKTEDGEQVYGLMVGFKSDFADHAGNAVGSVYDVAAEFTMMGISPKVQTCPFGRDSKLPELKKNYDHLEKLYNDSFIQVQAYKNTVKTLELQKD